MEYMDNREVLHKEFVEQKKILENVDVLILFGKTVLNVMIINVLREIGFGNINIKIFDKKKFEDGYKLCKEERKMIILCAMRKKVLRSMEEDCKNIFPGIPFFDSFAIYFHWVTTYCFRDCDYEVLADTLMDVRRENVIHGIDCINTTFCNMNCEECSNGIPLRKVRKHISNEIIVSSIEKVTNIKSLCNCNIQGGEAFLNTNLTDLISQISQNPRIAFITLATNGTITPTEECVMAMKKAGVLIRISDYGELSKKKNEIKSLVAERYVPCDGYARAERWSSYGNFYDRRRSERENCDIASKCFFGTNDLMLYDGKLFCCCRTLYAEGMGVENEIIKDNVIDLQSMKDSNKLLDVINGKYLHKMCDYCDFPMQEIVPGKQGERYEK